MIGPGSSRKPCLQDTIVSDEAFSFLREQLSAPIGRNCFRAITVPIERTSLTGALKFDGTETWIYWATPSGEETLAWGAAWKRALATQNRFAAAERSVSTLWDRIERRSFPGTRKPNLKVFSGFAFDPAGPHDGEWDGIPSNYCVFPSICITCSRGSCRATVISGRDSYREALHGFSDLLGSLSPPLTGTQENRAFTLDAAHEATGENQIAQWVRSIASIKDGITSGRFQKVVAARSVLHSLSRTPDIRKALDLLALRYPDSYRFAAFLGKKLFLAATPELLVHKRASRFTTHALAGSMPFGANAQAKYAARRALLRSAKDSDEHSLVVEAIRRSVGGFAKTLEVSKSPRIILYGDIAHLETPLEGVLEHDVHVLRLVSAIHPTPAVGGVPSDEALEWIRVNEEVPRGWYAGPIGWFDENGDGCFVTAIRSALLAPGSARLFAGAGIVADSDPVTEYEETEAKLKPMRLALGLSNDVW